MTATFNPRNLAVSINSQSIGAATAPPTATIEAQVPTCSVVISSQTASVIAEADRLEVSTGIPIVREFVGGEPYTGDYVVVPLADNSVVLPTTNKILHDDVTVTKVPYFETSNTSGTTVYIASEV